MRNKLLIRPYAQMRKAFNMQFKIINRKIQ